MSLNQAGYDGAAAGNRQRDDGWASNSAPRSTSHEYAASSANVDSGQLSAV